MSGETIDTSKVQWDSNPNSLNPKDIVWDTAQSSPFKNLAPYYSGPLAPIRMAADLQSVGQNFLNRSAYRLGDYVTQKAAQTSMSPENAARLGFAANIGLQAIPVVAGSMIGKAFQPAMQSTGKSLMQSALKPDKFARESGAAEKGIQTMLDEGIGVTEGSLRNLDTRIGTLNSQIKDAIKNSTAVVNRDEVVKSLDSVFDKAAKQARPEGDLKAVVDGMDEFLRNHAKDIPVQLAQQIKQGTYATLGDKAYGSGLKPAIQRDIDKGLARGLKEGIGKAIPQVVPLNQEESKLINARDLIENRLSAQGNNNPIGLGWLNPATVLPWMLERNPGMLSLAARAAYSGSGVIPTLAGGMAGGLLGNYIGQPNQPNWLPQWNKSQ